MKLFCLIVLLSLSHFALSVEQCDCIKRIPMELNDFNVDRYQPWAQNTHLESKHFKEINSKNKKELDSDMNVMNYSSCMIKCNGQNCMVECLSFESDYILTSYYYKLNNNECYESTMGGVFEINEKCSFIKYNNELYYQLENEEHLKLFYSFRSGKFEIGKPGGIEVSDVQIELIKEGAYSVDIPYLNLDKPLMFTKDVNYYCFNALTEIKKDYNKESLDSECQKSFNFIKKADNNQGLAMNYIKFPDTDI